MASSWIRSWWRLNRRSFGIREFEDIRMYLAYLKDPSGNKICAIKVFR